jgi:hypothetical protein
MEEEGRHTHDPASADALLRHAIDYMRAAINVCELFDNTYHETCYEPNPLAHLPGEPESVIVVAKHDDDMLEFLEEFRSVGLMAYAATQRCHTARSIIGNRIMVLGKPYYQFNEESNMKYTALLSKTSKPTTF